MVNLLEDHHKTNSDDVVVQLLVIIVASMTEMAALLLRIALDLALEDIDIIDSETNNPFLIQIFLEDIVTLLDLFHNFVELLAIHLGHQLDQLLFILSLTAIYFGIVLLSS
jgi:hypothetical protein